MSITVLEERQVEERREVAGSRNPFEDYTASLHLEYDARIELYRAVYDNNLQLSAFIFPKRLQLTPAHILTLDQRFTGFSKLVHRDFEQVTLYEVKEELARLAKPRESYETKYHKLRGSDLPIIEERYNPTYQDWIISCIQHMEL